MPQRLVKSMVKLPCALRIVISHIAPFHHDVAQRDRSKFNLALMPAEVSSGVILAFSSSSSIDLNIFPPGEPVSDAIDLMPGI